MSYSSTILADSPTAYWRLGDASGLVAHDSSGNGYNATLPSTGIVYSQTGAIIGDTNTSILFSSTATMALPYTLNPSTWTALSLEFWIKTGSSWQYVVVTTSNITGITTLYLNGLVYSSGTGDFVGIDTDIYYAGSPLSGNLDEIGLYNYVLTSAQVLNHYLVGIAASLFYASNVAQTLGGLVLSDQMATTTGGAETSVSVTAPASGTNLYVELLAQGGSSGGTASLPAPTGKGWSINVQGNTILAGNWYSVFTLAKSGTSKSGASLIVRWSRRTMDGTYYTIGTSTLSGQTYSTSKTSYTVPSVTVNFPWQFVSNEVLYIDTFVFNGSTAWASDVFTIYVSNSATQGVANDGVTTAPAMLTTPTGLTCLVGANGFQTGTGLSVKNESFTLADMIDQRSVLTLTAEDPNGNISFTPNMPVILSDSNQGKIYDGYLASDQMSKVSADPSILQREHKLTFADHHRDYDKEANGILGVNTNGTNYLNWSAGDIACDFIDKVEVNNNIWGEYAIEADYTQAAFALGTLSGTTATSTTSPFTYAPNTASPPVTTNTGDLELTRAGSQFTLTEATTSDFSSGTLTNMTASNNELTPTTQSAIELQVQFPQTYGQNQIANNTWDGTNNANNVAQFPEFIGNSVQVEIWSGSRNIATTDSLNYDIWVSSTSAAYLAGIDFTCSDGTTFSASAATYNCVGGHTAGIIGYWDQNGLSADILTDLSGSAKDAWYTRSIPMAGSNLGGNAAVNQSEPPNLAGKTITSVSACIWGSSTGSYTVYFKNIYLSSASGSPFFSTSATQTQVNPPVISNAGGYINSSTIANVVSVFLPQSSYRVSPSHSISGVGLVQDSNIQWTASLPTTGSANTLPVSALSPTSANSQSTGVSPSMVVQISYDAGVTWLNCVNQGALPGLPAGANVSGVSFLLKELFNAGSDPSALPSLDNVTMTINSAAAQTTSDITATYGNTSEWNTGTASGLAPNANGDLTIGATFTPAWGSNSTAGQTLFYGPWNTTPVAVISNSASGGVYTMTTTSTTGGTGAYGLSRFDFAGTTLNGVLQADFTCSNWSSQFGRVGFLYRTTTWSNEQSYTGGVPYFYDIPTYDGYFVWFSGNTSQTYGSHVELGVATGTGGGTYTTLGTSGISFTAGTYYTLKVIFTGNRHQVFINGTLYIDQIDNTISTPGGIGLRCSYLVNNHMNVKNCTVQATGGGSGIWTSPSTSISSLGTCGNTQINWSEVSQGGRTQSTALVLTSIDGGSTYQQCTNGGAIPNLSSGTNVSGKSVLTKIILYGADYVTTPFITGLNLRVCGSYGTVSGTRISPAISLTPVGYVASSNVAYHANIPTNTTMTVQTTQDLSTYHTVGSSGAGETLPYWTNQPSFTQDLFSSVTSSNYTNTFKSGGSAATVTYDTTNSRITLVGGSGGLYLYNAINCADVDLLCDMDESDAGGLTWHNQGDGLNYYELGVYDASSSGGFTNQLRLYKVSSGTRSLLGSASSVTFTRNTFHRIKVKMKSGLINVYWDGSCKQSYLDTSPIGSGQVGLRNDGGTSRYYQLYVQPLGTNLSGQVVYTKVTLTTSDPSQMPQLFTLLCCVRGPSIGTGATIPQLHPVTLSFASYLSAEMDALTQASQDPNMAGGFFWYVDKWKQFRFGARSARQGAFPLQSAIDTAQSSGYLLYQPVMAQPVSLTNSADPLRNQQVITNVSGLVTPPTVALAGDGNTTSWTLGYPVYSAPIILVNGQPATVGVQGVDNQKQFYWQPGSTTINYDGTLPKLPSGTVIDVTYVGQSTINTIVNNSTAIATQAAIELNSGNIAEIESALTFAPNGASTPNGMTSTQATTFAQGLLNRFGNNAPSELMGTTLYQGLVPGTTVQTFIPELGLWNVSLPIVKVTTTAFQSNNGIIYLSSVDCTNGASQTSWQRVWF